MTNDTNDFREWLNDNLADPSTIETPSCFDAWLNDIDERGHIEIPGHLSSSGNPVTSWWPELVPGGSRLLMNPDTGSVDTLENWQADQASAGWPLDDLKKLVPVRWAGSEWVEE